MNWYQQNSHKWDWGLSWRGRYLECKDINDDVMGVNLPADTPRWVKKSEQ